MDTWNYSDFWEESINQLKKEYTENGKKHEFELWFKAVYEKSEKEKIIVSVPSLFYRDQMKNKGYKKAIEDKIAELCGMHISTEYIIKEKAVSQKEEKSIQEDNTIVEIKNTNSKTKEKHPLLSSDFTFDTYVKCEDNKFAYNAGLAVSKNPGTAYNPLLIYGGVGVGKTHLMQAIGNAIWQNIKGKVIYITAENFTNEFIDSINTNTMNKFKNKYRSADALLIDDIQFLQKKDGTQEELFNTFEALYNSKKQIVFTCDRPVSELKNLTERLKSRFEMGLNVDISTPNFEGRRAILEKRITTDPSFKSVIIKPEVLDLIAQNVETNVRDLIASLIKIKGYSELVGEEVTLEIAKKQLRDNFFSPRTENISVENIQKVVADYYHISYTDLKGSKRTKNIMLPRQIAIYIVQELCELSTTEIGREFGGRDHTTIMHALNKIKEMLMVDPTFDSTIQLLIRAVKDYKK